MIYYVFSKIIFPNEQINRVVCFLDLISNSTKFYFHWNREYKLNLNRIFLLSLQTLEQSRLQSLTNIKPNKCTRCSKTLHINSGKFSVAFEYIKSYVYLAIFLEEIGLNQQTLVKSKNRKNISLVLFIYKFTSWFINKSSLFFYVSLPRQKIGQVIQLK